MVKFKMNGNDVTKRRLQEKQLDYVIIYARTNFKEALKLKERLASLELDGRLYDSEDGDAFETWRLENANEMQRDLYGRSTFKFFIITNELADDIDFIQQKNELIQADLRKRDQSVIPIWFVSKYDLDDEAFDALYGITSLQGLDPKSSYFETKVRKMADMEMFVNKKRERAATQKKKYEKYLEQEKEHMEKNPQREPRVQRYIPPADDEGQSSPKLQKVGSVCYTVDKQFWRDFCTPMGGGLMADDERLASYSMSYQPSESDGLDRDITMDEGPDSKQPASVFQESINSHAGSSKMVVNGSTVKITHPSGEGETPMESTGCTAEMQNMNVQK